MAEYNNLLHMGYDYEKPDEYIDPMKPIIEEIMGEFRIQQEDNVMKAVADVGIYVDKPRLMQALTDAKAFYEEGYRAAMQRADVVEVRHGEWKDKARSGLSVNGYMVCSECDVIIPNCDDKTHYCLYTLNFCPNCGAKMDGKGEGE